jgi:hypothetical protein
MHPCISVSNYSLKEVWLFFVDPITSPFENTKTRVPTDYVYFKVYIGQIRVTSLVSQCLEYWCKSYSLLNDFSLKIQQKSKMWMESRLSHNSDIAFGFYSKLKLQINKYEITL